MSIRHYFKLTSQREVEENVCEEDYSALEVYSFEGDIIDEKISTPLEQNYRRYVRPSCHAFERAELIRNGRM